MLKGVVTGLAIGTSGMALADGTVWSVRPSFDNEDARYEISGLTCAGSDGAGRWCFAVNDEKSYGQFFTLDIERRRLRPKKRLRLLPKEGFDEADLEGAAYHDGYVYALGSHGLSRTGQEFQRSRFFIYRFPVDPVTGAPGFEVKRKSVVDQVERSDVLLPLLRGLTGLGATPERSVIDNLGNFEGLAVRGGRLFAGFRAPSDRQGAAILDVALDHVFGDAPAEAVIHRLDLGMRYGVRDLAPFDDGFLVLASAESVPELIPIIWFWRPGTAPLLLRALPVPPGWKAEGLLPLGPAAAPGGERVLLVFDSQKNGAPLEFVIPAPGR
ncbi:MAG: DUF3616 domain-containing protein [Pseudomonadota bacterium]